MKIELRIRQYIWWYLIGTLFIIIYSISYYNFNMLRPYDWRLILLFFVGSLIAGLIIKYEEDEIPIIPEIIIGVYEGFIFFISYWIILGVIIEQILTKPASISPIALMISSTAFVTLIIFIPINILNGFISRVFRAYLNSRK